MNYRTVFAPMMFDETIEPMVKSALIIAGANKGHVMAQHVRRSLDYYPPVDMYTGPAALSPRVLEQHTEAERQVAERQKAIFDETCDKVGAHIVELDQAHMKDGLTASWTDVQGMVPDSLGYAARMADLCVCAIPGQQHSVFKRDLLENLLMASARPLLLVPEAGLSALPKSAMVAWDGSGPAALALSAALPFLSVAETVRIVTVGRQDNLAPGPGAALNYLARHDIAASSEVLTRKKQSVCDCLLEHAAEQGDDLIIMGGYSHSRFRETLLGGVTRQMISRADRAIFMAH